MTDGRTNTTVARGDLDFNSILIFGMGMMGASLALALRQSDRFQGRVAGVVRSERSAKLIRDQQLADEVYRLETAAPGAANDGGAADSSRVWPAGLPAPDNFDLIVLGLPVGGAVEMLPKLGEFRGIITDMSSTGAVARRAEDFADMRFVGAHPMCGSEDSGPGAARAGLFQDRLCLLLDRRLRAGAPAAPGTYGDDLERVRALWETLGMKTYAVDADRHDEIVGVLSHGPHVLSGLLTLWARGFDSVSTALNESPLPITGGGFKDMARIAGSNPEMWYEILDTNRASVVESLKVFQKEMGELVAKLEAGRGDEEDRVFWYDWFKRARENRNFLCGIEEE